MVLHDQWSQSHGSGSWGRRRRTTAFSSVFNNPVPMTAANQPNNRDQRPNPLISVSELFMTKRSGRPLPGGARL